MNNLIWDVAGMTQSCKAGDALGDFIRRSRPISDMSYRRLNSQAFAKCARSHDLLRSSLRIACEVNPSGWVILSHDFTNLPHRRDRRKKSPSVSALIGGKNRRWWSNSPRSAYKIARCVAGLRKLAHQPSPWLIQRSALRSTEVARVK